LKELGHSRCSDGSGGEDEEGSGEEEPCPVLTDEWAILEDSGGAAAALRAVDLDLLDPSQARSRVPRRATATVARIVRLPFLD